MKLGQVATRLVGHFSPQDDRRLPTFLLAFSLLFIAMGAWSLATPLGAAPDEPAQLARAASIVRGQVLAPTDHHFRYGGNVAVTVRIPEVFASLADADKACYRFNSSIPAGCAPPPSKRTTTVSAATYVGRYPPLYYLLVGAPTRVLVSAAGIRAARLVSCALGAFFVALAISSLRRCRGAPLLVPGAAVAVSPMALFLPSVINPSGFEITSAISAWTAAMALQSLPATEVRRSDVGVLGLSLASVGLSRSLGPLWIVCVLLAMVVLRSRHGLRPLLQRRDTRIWLAGVALAALSTVAWDLYAHALRTMAGVRPPPGTGEVTLIEDLIRRLPSLLTQSIGIFGWLDTPSPLVVYALWCLCIGLLVLLGLSSGSRRGGGLTVGVVLAWAGLVVVLGLASVRSRGFVGQGRDFLGIGVAVPIAGATAAGAALLTPTRTQRLTWTILAAVVLAQIIDFYWGLRRYTVGLHGRLDILRVAGPGWLPVSVPVLLSVFVAAMVGYAAVLSRCVRHMVEPRAASEPVPVS